MSRLNFKLEATSPGSLARAGRFTTLHGEVLTPIFMPVGTQATVKSQTVESLKTAGSNVLLANTYHLMLRPGAEVFRRLGGIHRFMNWDRPVLTDSGGFQIFSLPHSRQMDEAGAQFRSYVDGKLHLLSPETSIDMQRAIGSDIMMVLDQCIPSTAPREQAHAAMQLTHRWAKRSLTAREDSPAAMFGIIQGACFEDLRKQSAQILCEMGFDGFAIGGLAVGESKAEREDMTAFTTPLMPTDLPRYLMGVGTPIDILEAVHRGVDMFDCILPSALSQRGVAFTSIGKLQLRRSVYKFSDARLDPACACSTCQTFSRAYLHHLTKSDEVLGWKLLSDHNLHFYHRLMREMRAAILDARFSEFYARTRPSLLASDNDNPAQTPKRSRTSLRAEKRLSLGDYVIHESEQGFSSIQQVSSGEIMHSVNRPTDEARRLYIEQSRLAERLKTAPHTAEPNGLDVQSIPQAAASGSPIVIWDVGLGAATNAMAAIECFESLYKIAHRAEVIGPRPYDLRPLTIVSFERDLDPLRLALRAPEKFEHLRHRAPHRLLAEGQWSHEAAPLSWQLTQGDFRETYLTAPLPDLVFYDPFSAKVDGPLWQPEFFTELYSFWCASPGAGDGKSDIELYNYSVSTAVRAALLSAGFYVASGVGTGPKSETTIAHTRAPHSARLLGSQWLEKWSRSQAQVPPQLSAEAREAFRKRILTHPQFSGLR